MNKRLGTDFDQELVDKFCNGQLQPAAFAALVMQHEYAGLERFCDIDLGFEHAQLAYEFRDPASISVEEFEAMANSPSGLVYPTGASQLKAITMFRAFLSGDERFCFEHNPLKPKVGAYLFGPPGVAKTHLFVAFAKEIKAIVNQRLNNLRVMVTDFVKRALDEACKKSGDLVDTGANRRTIVLDSGEEELDARSYLDKEIADLRRKIRAFPVQPTDFLYIGFEELCRIFRQREEGNRASQAIVNAKIVMVDDVHLRGGSADHFDALYALIEERYKAGRPGTFLTTNISVDKLGGEDEMIARRIKGRCEQRLLFVDFADCKDWRELLAEKHIKAISDSLDQEVATLLTTDEAAYMRGAGQK